MSFLTIESVCKNYGATAALTDVSLAVERGSRTAVIGPSGSGKTTLLRIIAGSETPDSGRLVLDGEVLADGAAFVPAWRRGIGIVAQDGALFPHLNIADNIGFGLPRHDAGRTARIHDLMTMVELDASLLQRRPDQLSGGQQQRVALARALAPGPRLMLLDEPFSALDTALRVSTRKAVASLLGAAGITTILVTHDQTEALSFADQVAVMRQGRLLQTGLPRDLYLHPVDAMVAEFLGDAIILSAEIKDGWALCALGHIAVEQGGRQGAARIMLRPEQIGLVPVVEGGPGKIFGKVVETDFGGSLCTAVVEVAGAGLLLTLRRPPMETPPAGTAVEITVTGTAHVLGETSPRRP
ncbi:MAG: ABC transporter ATP-binding protein [Parvibaculaceae bacterium]|nr:ABC transporter ATP-binding protein [Parvibaculaceae bacterium]